MNVRTKDGNDRSPGWARWLFLSLAVVLSISVQACGDDNGTPPPPSLRFGQLGEIRVGVVAPLVFDQGVGELQQILTWGTSGAWVLREIISYRGLEGDETVTKNEGDPIAFASAYASLITQLNESDGVELFSIPPFLEGVCAPGRTRVTISIWDEVRGEEVSWARCASGTLGTLQTSEAGPDVEAGRVIQAAILERDYTQGSDFGSSYLGSLPFGTLDRGEDSGAGLEEPKTFLSIPAGNPDPPTGWLAFWASHDGRNPSTIPEVDWVREMVLVAAVGERNEAGDSVEVRRVLWTGERALVELYERVPGNFCSPATRDHYPFHVVVSPRTLLPPDFTSVDTVRIPCGE